ncbi:hypothetical protein [Comamonas sp. JC664]|uniref:hypothetical protein n=1 Tax=Comamonas sp. JC664 TaxID=2801917 RepID=UPI003670D505
MFMPVGSAAVDLWGVKHTALDRKYGASMLAVDAAPARKNGSTRPCTMTSGTSMCRCSPRLWTSPCWRQDHARAGVRHQAGQIFVLDRATGQPLTAVEERRVPAGKIDGETYSPTQPFSVGMPNIGADDMRESDMWGATPFDQLLCRLKFKSKRYTGLFTPPAPMPR